jgi:hypothetical protein
MTWHVLDDIFMSLNWRRAQGGDDKKTLGRKIFFCMEIIYCESFSSETTDLRLFFDGRSKRPRIHGRWHTSAGGI